MMRPALRMAARSLMIVAIAACDVWTETATLPGQVASGGEVDVGRLAPGIHPIFVPRSGQGSIHLDLLLVQVGEGERAASIQGELTVHPGSIQVANVVAPSGVLAAWNPVAEGSIRLAAIAVGGFPDGPILTIEIIGDREMQRGDLTFHVEEITSYTGFQDVTETLILEDTPLMSSTPIPSRVLH